MHATGRSQVPGGVHDKLRPVTAAALSHSPMHTVMMPSEGQALSGYVHAPSQRALYGACGARRMHAASADIRSCHTPAASVRVNPSRSMQ
jgi:hypothetical protein